MKDISDGPLTWAVCAREVALVEREAFQRLVSGSFELSNNLRIDSHSASLGAISARHLHALVRQPGSAPCTPTTQSPFCRCDDWSARASPDGLDGEAAVRRRPAGLA